MSEGKFNSFTEFGKAFKQETNEDLRRQTEAELEKIKDDLDSIPEGPLKSSLSEIEYISFVHPINKRESGDKKDAGSINAVVFSRTPSGKLKNHTWSVSRSGRIGPIEAIPPELADKREEIAFEIVSLIEKIKPASIYLTDTEFIPEADPGEERVSLEGGPGPGRPIDPEREEFLATLKGVLFRCVHQEKGLEKYQLVVHPDYLYLENVYIGHAAYFLSPSERIDTEAIRKELEAEIEARGETNTIDEDTLKKEIIKRYWDPIGDRAKTKGKLLELGAKRIIHTPDKWKEKILEEISSRSFENTNV